LTFTYIHQLKPSTGGRKKWQYEENENKISYYEKHDILLQNTRFDFSILETIEFWFRMITFRCSFTILGSTIIGVQTEGSATYSSLITLGSVLTTGSVITGLPILGFSKKSNNQNPTKGYV